MKLKNDIITLRLRIKEHSATDLESMHTLLSDPKAMYYLQDIFCKTISDTKNNLDAAIAEIEKSDRKKFFFRIELLDGSYVGEIGFTILLDSQIGKIAELGYFILEKYWHGGIASEAVKAVIDFGFNELNIYKIETGCIKNNCWSERIMLKNGMKREAYKKHHVLHDGELKDRVEYALFRNDWKA